MGGRNVAGGGPLGNIILGAVITATRRPSGLHKTYFYSLVNSILINEIIYDLNLTISIDYSIVIQEAHR